MQILPLLLAPLMFMPQTAIETPDTRDVELPPLYQAQPETQPTGGDDYRIESDADEKYEEMKAALDEKFQKMFDLKKELDAIGAESEAKWQEYWAMHNAYEKQLKRLIAIWTKMQVARM